MSRGHRGFTIIEAVAVLIIVAILAVVAVPRLVGRTAVETRAFRDDTLAMLQYAQATARAGRRLVCVSLTATSITLTMRSAPGSTPPTCDTALTGPAGETPFSRTAPAGVTLATSPATAAFTFDALGRPSFATALTVQVVGEATYDIVVEPETGYAHGQI